MLIEAKKETNILDSYYIPFHCRKYEVSQSMCKNNMASEMNILSNGFEGYWNKETIYYKL